MHYFTRNELLHLQSFENKTLVGVWYVLWRNLKKNAGGYEALDWLILDFADHTQLILTTDEENTGIELKDTFDFEQKEKEVLKQFGGQVILIKQDMRQEPPWIDAMTKPLAWIGLQEEKEGHYSSEAIRLDFEDWAIDIGLEEEGLRVDVGIA